MEHNNQAKTVFRFPTYDREEATTLLTKDSSVYEKFLLLTPELQEELISFLYGESGTEDHLRSVF